MSESSQWLFTAFSFSQLQLTGILILSHKSFDERNEVYYRISFLTSESALKRSEIKQSWRSGVSRESRLHLCLRLSPLASELQSRQRASSRGGRVTLPSPAAGLHQVHRHLVRGLHPSRDALQQAHLPWEALPRPAEPHSG